MRSIKDADFTAAANELLRYIKPGIWEKWMEDGLRNQVELYKTFILEDLDAIKSRKNLKSNIWVKARALPERQFLSWLDNDKRAKKLSLMIYRLRGMLIDGSAIGQLRLL